MFNNLKLMAKLAIPSLILVLVAVGLVALAHSSLATLERNTTHTIEVRATRLFLAQRLAIALDEAVIAEKNAIIETDETLMTTEIVHYQANRTSASETIERLIALADTPERRAILTGIRTDIGAFSAAAERSFSHSLRKENDRAVRISKRRSVPSGPSSPRPWPPGSLPTCVTWKPPSGTRPRSPRPPRTP